MFWNLNLFWYLYLFCLLLLYLSPIISIWMTREIKRESASYIRQVLMLMV